MSSEISITQRLERHFEAIHNHIAKIKQEEASFHRELQELEEKRKAFESVETSLELQIKQLDELIEDWKLERQRLGMKRKRLEGAQRNEGEEEEDCTDPITSKRNLDYPINAHV